jgi:hypothetical protein
VRQADAVPGHGAGRLLRLKLEDFEDTAARHANPPDLARRRVVGDSEKSPHAIGRRIGDANERTAEHLPVEPHGLVEVRHRYAGMAERSSFHKLVSRM